MAEFYPINLLRLFSKSLYLFRSHLFQFKSRFFKFNFLMLSL